MPRSRIAKTFDKLRAGELPAPTAVVEFDGDGLGIPCSGCGEVIDRSEHSHFFRIGTGTFLRFHRVCHETWLRFKRPP